MSGATFEALWEPIVQNFGKAGVDLLMRMVREAALAHPDDREAHFLPEDAKRYRRSLLRWKSKAMKALDVGESPDVPYDSPILPPEIMEEVQVRLELVEPRAGVEAAFEAVVAKYGLDPQAS